MTKGVTKALQKCDGCVTYVTDVLQICSKEGPVYVLLHVPPAVSSIYTIEVLLCECKILYTGLRGLMSAIIRRNQ